MSPAPVARSLRPASARLQSYGKETALLDQVARFLRIGLDLGESALVVAAGSHLTGLRSRLGGERIAYVDADEVLGKVLQGGSFDHALFDRLLGQAASAAVATGKGRARAYGELVARLLATGRPELAQEAETAWNRVLSGMPITLLCAYPTAAPATAGEGGGALQATARAPLAPSAWSAGDETLRGCLQALDGVAQWLAQAGRDLPVQQIDGTTRGLLHDVGSAATHLAASLGGLLEAASAQTPARPGPGPGAVAADAPPR